MRNVEQKMAVETRVIKIVLMYECPECATTSEYTANIDKATTPWVKRTVYRGAALEFVYSEE